MSVYVDELKKKAEKKFNKSKEINSINLAMNNIVQWNNVFLTLIFVVLGAFAFLCMGYYLQISIKNNVFSLTDFIELLPFAVCTNIILWGLKSFVTYSVWKGLIKKEEDYDSCFSFFTIEGTSDISYLILMPLFFIFALVFSPYFAGLVLGASVFFKYFLMYKSYPELLKHVSTADKILYITSSIGTLVLIKTIISCF